MNPEFSQDEYAALEAEMHELNNEHRDLDVAIFALEQLGSCDQLQIQRLKKRKLQLKDRLAEIFEKITPDIIA